MPFSFNDELFHKKNLAGMDFLYLDLNEKKIKKGSAKR